jgi:predicted NAD/FAD-binding protein
MPKKIAVIGGGIAGLSAAYFLDKKHEVTLFEKDGQLGGNAHTITTRDGLQFDIAAAVFGKKSYPNFVRLLKEVKVDTCTFRGVGVGMRNLDSGEEHFFVTDPRGLFVQRFSMLYGRDRKSLLSMLGWCATLRTGQRYYREGRFEGLSLREALEMIPPFEGDGHLLFVFRLCIVTSMYYDEVMAAPAEFIFGKMETHADFFSHRALWRLFHARGNTLSYVTALSEPYRERVILNSKIRSVARRSDGIRIRTGDRGEMAFDRVVFACNADRALELLEEPTDRERELLGAWKFKDGPIVVHRDWSSFPQRENYNIYTYLYTNRGGHPHTSISGHIRCLRHIPNDCQYISSQHPNFPIDEELTEYRKVFRTPIYDNHSVPTVRRLPVLNGVRGTYYCGSYFGYGLHEDCVNSAMTVARLLGVDPFDK